MEGIKLSNGHILDYVVASGALEFDGRGWPWERPLVWLDLIERQHFTITLKSLTRQKRVGNLNLLHPWTCVRLLAGGAVNKVGLTNPGIDTWLDEIAPTINFNQLDIIISLVGNEEELLEMVEKTKHLNIVGYEINYSCPNAGVNPNPQIIIDAVKKVCTASDHPVIIKVSVSQNYLAIADGLRGVAEAISINSVPWKMVYGDKRSPLWPLEKKDGMGGGGVSGKPAQKLNWKAVRELAEQGALPVIAPSIVRYKDMATVEELGAMAISFGAIHMPSKWWWLMPWTIFTNPCKPTRFVLRRQREAAKRWR